MGSKRGTEERLIDPTSQEFADHLKGLDSRINVNKFISMARSIAAKKFRELPANASDARKVAHERNINFDISISMAHDPDALIMEYFNLYKPSATPYDNDHFERILDMERDFACQFGFDPIEVTPDIDKPLPNGMTQVGQAIMLSDDIEEVRRLIEEEGASPVALCGGSTPLELAEQLGRAKVADYLRDIEKMSA
tara:strand:- start:44095 stop:44679 length:585 start_codon:yes stop_codon:yes gene_type:complete